MTGNEHHLDVLVEVGSTGRARITGTDVPVLAGLGMILVTILGVVYLATNAPGCASAEGVKGAISLLRAP